MGAGAKCDPTRVNISDISYTIYDPLARSVRRRLRLQGISGGIPVAYSTEVPSDVKLLPLPEEEFQKGNVKELGVFDDFRVRILPVLGMVLFFSTRKHHLELIDVRFRGPLPSIFGLHIATYILCELAEKPILNPLPIKNRKKLYERLLRDLLTRESKLTGHLLKYVCPWVSSRMNFLYLCSKLPIDEDDVALVFEDLHLGRSVIPPHNVPSRPVLVRWDPELPLTLDNCVVMDHGECEKHLKECYAKDDGDRRHPRDVWGPEVEKIVSRRARDIARNREWVM
jgi:tRNA threonylcarbamoyladenosine dehydratase